MKDVYKQSDIDALILRAKFNKKRKKTQMNVELDAIAMAEGYGNWSQLANRFKRDLDIADPIPILFSSVRASFGPVAAMAPGTAYMSFSPEISFQDPLRGLLVYVDNASRHIIAADIVMEVVEGAAMAKGDALAKLTAAAEARSFVELTEDFPFLTQFVFSDQYMQYVGCVGPWHAAALLVAVSDRIALQSFGRTPAWFRAPLHATLFDADVGHAMGGDDDVELIRCFRLPRFREALKFDRLIAELTVIKHGREDERRFHHWLARVIEMLFIDSFTKVDVSPNGNGRERRDIVATNYARNGFWQRVLADYKARLVVFEAKNYSKPTAADFAQVAGYLDQPHYGKVGFLVTHGTREDVVDCGMQVRAKYHQSGQRKLIIVLTSEHLVQMLRQRALFRSESVEAVLDEVLNQHLMRYLPG